MKAQICPVCNGDGKVRVIGQRGLKTCHGCDGKGWIMMPEDKKQEIYLDKS